MNNKSAPQKVFALIDGKSVFYRGYYAMPNLMTRDGTPTGGVYGFVSLALELLNRIQPDYVAVAWDKPKTNIRRRLAIYDKYKANRKPAPPDFYAQIPILHELLGAFGWPLYELDDYEADDIMGTLSEQANKRGIRTIMISSDLDMLQLLDSDTELYALKKGLANLEKFDTKAFEQKYGVRVEQFLDVKSLKGDASDNIPGVAGVGEKTALNLIKEFGTLDNLYKNLDSEFIKKSLREKLISGKENAFMSRELGKIWCDAPIELDLKAVDVRKMNSAKLHEKLTELEFTSLIKRLPKYMKDSENNLEIANIKLAGIKLENLTDSARVQLVVADKIVVATSESDENLLLLSANKETANCVNWETASEILKGKNIISHDAKFLAEEFLARNLSADFAVEFDTKLAAFLLNSLRKSPSLAEAIGFVEFDEKGEIRNLNDKEKISAVWSLYDSQKTELAKNAKLNKLAREVDFPLQAIIAKIEQRGVRLDSKLLNKMSEKLAEKIQKIEKNIWKMVGYEFNISSTKQLSEALFDKLGLSTAGLKRGQRGNYSTGQKELDKLRGKHPIIEEIEKIRELLKLKNTYVDALPKLVDKNGYLHTSFRQDVTATGRLSSSNPNLQNIPIRTELGRELRHAFIASEGKTLISADYSQFELRLAAALADDKKMIELFSHDDVDIHAQTAAEAFGVPINEVTSTQRRNAKVINFGVLYGMSPHGLAAATGMSFADAKHFIERYFEIRKPIREFNDATIKQAETKGYVETMFGRRRPTPDVKAANFAVRAAAQRAAANMPIQGTEADLMKMAMIKIEKEISNCRQILQIHDSILVECDANDAKKVGEKMREIMENVYPDFTVKLKVDVKFGKTWAEL